MPKFEKPQKRNPHQLAIKQHTFPSRSIARFTDSNGTVALHMLQVAGKIRPAKPDDKIFCARRTWDQGAEDFSKTLEDPFQALVDLVIDNPDLIFDREQAHVISLFCSLWRTRAEVRDNPRQDEVLRGVLPGPGRSKEEEEGLEKCGLAFARGTTIPARVMNGADVRRQVDRFLIEHPAAMWGVVRALGGEFVVPDWPVLAFIPINPTLALAAPAINQTLDRDAVRLINKQLRLGSRRYFFARDFTACP